MTKLKNKDYESIEPIVKKHIKDPIEYWKKLIEGSQLLPQYMKNR